MLRDRRRFAKEGHSSDAHVAQAIAAWGGWSWVPHPAPSAERSCGDGDAEQRNRGSPEPGGPPYAVMLKGLESASVKPAALA
jgi:hypothetical protein